MHGCSSEIEPELIFLSTLAYWSFTYRNLNFEIKTGGLHYDTGLGAAPPCIYT